MSTREIIQEKEVHMYPELVELYELTEDEIENCYVTDIFRCDPDYFNWITPNKYPLLKIPFIEVLDKYIIVPDDDFIQVATDYEIEKLSDKCKLMLTRFFDDNWKDYFPDTNHRTWKDFENIRLGIAYRGGSGYAYSLHSYKSK